MARQTTTRAAQAAPKQAPTGNLPAKGEDRRPAIVQFREYAEARMKTLEDALPPHIPPRRFLSVAITALQANPKLLICTFPSIWNACVLAAHDGLLPNGREGAIAPFGKNEEGKAKENIATWMPMIDGLRKKIFETGKVKSWQVNVVYEKDHFDYMLGDEPFLEHKPFMLGDPGGVIGAYSIAKLDNGEIVREVMSAYQINLVKNKSKTKDSGPWSDPQSFPEMCKKTVGRRHYKQLPHSESLDAIFARMDQEEGHPDPEAPPVETTPRRRVSPTNVMDVYADGAGNVIEHDADGVVDEEMRDDRAQQDNGKAEGSGPQTGESQSAGETRRDASSPTGDASKDTAAASDNKPAAAKDDGASNSASASSSADTRADGGASPGGGAGEAGATASGTAGASASTSAGELPLDEEPAGADRPWPPGFKPTDLPEYERYLKTNLASFKYAEQIAPWWNSEGEKALRVACKVEADYQRLMNLAQARRRELPTKPQG